ncbi:MAG: hypothetical protein HYV95_06985 [Opitutae bacterium]|nr:hypothetical protein [Opitutae bacterium]
MTTLWRSLTPPQRRSIVILTVVAAGLYLTMRWLPTGTNLSHMDFRVAEKGAIEFCDPANPQFIPVVAAKSPVTLTLTSDIVPAQRKEIGFTLTLRTASGKPIAPEDLLVTHTRKLHLLVADPTLQDYQHVHPEPGKRAGEWVFKLTPDRPGTYRVFADFTPAATARGLYASADFNVPGEVARVIRTTNVTAQIPGYNFELVMPALFRAGVPTDLKFRIETPGAEKRPVVLQPVMGAFAHLVAFDEARSGFAHLHPNEVDLAKPPDALHPELTFKITIPQPGRYVIWAQVNLDGRETFVPFWLDVLP